MGNNYVKMSVDDCALGVAFQHNNKYLLYTICISGRKETTFKKKENISYQRYNNYGDWYEFNGKTDKLEEILADYDPVFESIIFLKSRFKVECEFKAYKTTWECIKEWIVNVKETVKSVVSTGIGVTIGGGFLTWIFSLTAKNYLTQ